MEQKQLKPRNALNKAFLKLKLHRDEIDRFKANLLRLFDDINVAEREEFLKNLVSGFLKKTYYGEEYFINTKGDNDLVIHNGATAKTPVGVIIEAKKPTNKAEMISRGNMNAKAFWELLLYYLRERIQGKNIEVKHLVITNIFEWYIFDARLFDRVFAQNKDLVRKFNEFAEGRLAGTTTDFFYREIAQPFIALAQNELEYTYFDFRDYDKTLRNADKSDDRELIALYKLLSPQHLLKLPFANDSNSLDKGFYHELLHIIGLEETKQKGKKLIGRNKEGDRNPGSMLENAIIQLESLDKMGRLEKPSRYGDTPQERLFNVALELCITWINRILFLKLLEAQLVNFHKEDKAYEFLDSDKIKEYDDLDKLFFRVLAKRPADRMPEIQALFGKVPYLNSSLFEPTGLEHQSLFISNLEDNKKIPVLPSTVLKEGAKAKKRRGELSTLEYLFAFLGAYDFSSEGKEEILEEKKNLINASVLGLIFEKINGYKEGSFFTPGFITMYMCRETIRKAVVQKFNENKGWDCQDLNEIYNRITDIEEANQLVNSLRICDPAVGSGHFLVSALNEIIAVKKELGILRDRDGKRLKEYQIEVVNDELAITDEDGKPFEYHPGNKESQRVQETLFHEKQNLIENCLFGVDINPNSVKICRLRLWIELLKNAYYKPPKSPEGGPSKPSPLEGGRVGELQTLPNIDINIKCGNSLISRFPLDADLGAALKNSNHSISSYRLAVETYRNAKNKQVKRDMEKLIAEIKSGFRSEIARSDKRMVRLENKKRELFNLSQQHSLFEMTGPQKKAWDKKTKKLAADIKKREAEIEAIKDNKIYENAFEWRFEFPEVLDHNGDFIGFDVVMGNPPYIKEYEGKQIFDGLRQNEAYQGKMDIWYLFACDGIKLLKEKGYLSFIATNNWVTNAGAGKMRNFMLNNSRFVQMIDFNNYMVFDSASIQTMIMLFQKEKTDNYRFDYRKITDAKPTFEDALEILDKQPNEDVVCLTPTIVINHYLNKNLLFSAGLHEKLLDKIEMYGVLHLYKNEVANGIHPHHDFVNKKLHSISKNNLTIGQGIFGLSDQELEGLNLTEKEKSDLIRPYFTSTQFHRYYAEKENELWLIYTHSKFKNAHEILPYPNIKAHLDKFQDVITSDNKPYGLHRTRVEDFFKGEKIIVQRKCPNKPVFTYTNFDTYVSATFYVIKTKRLDQKYLTGLLNSKLIEFWLRNKGKMQGNNFQIDKAPLLNLPLIEPEEEIQNQISNLVSQIIALKSHAPTLDTRALEAQIDQLIYGLYGLTEEEVAVVEGALP